MKAKKLPPSRKLTAFAPASVFRRKILRGMSGASTIVSIARKATSRAADTPRREIVRAVAQPTSGAFENDPPCEQQRDDADRHVEEEDVLPACVAGEKATCEHADGCPACADCAPKAKCLVALGAFGEHVHNDRERRRQDDCRAESLKAAHRDQERVAAGEPAGEG